MKTILYNRLRKQIIIAGLLTALFPLLLTGIAFHYQYMGLYKNKIEEQMRYRSRSQAEAVDLFLNERTAILSVVADTQSLSTILQESRLSVLFKTMNQRADGFVDLGVIDSSGIQQAYVGPHNLKGFNYQSQSWFAEVMSKGVYISDVYMGFRNMPHFIIAVRRQENENTWILRATVDSEVFEGIVRSAKIGMTGDAFIINRAGIYQTTPRFHGTILEKSHLQPNLFGRGTTLLEFSHNGGIGQRYAGSWLSNGKWLLVTSEAGEETFKGMKRARFVDLFLIGVGVVFIVACTLISTRWTVRRLEQTDLKMNRLNAQLVQSDKMAALGKMAAGIAHEINNPLAVIIQKTGWIEDLLEEEEFQKSENIQELRNSVRKIEYHVERARKVVHSMLGYARRMEPRLEDVDVNDVLTQTIALLENYARLNDIRIQVNVQPDLPIIAGDQGQLQQVFMNLISNAIDAVDKNGTVIVTSEETSKMIVVHISDDGPGIPKELQERVFEPFFTTKHTNQGVGMGLWISFTIMEKLGGRLTFESTEGSGTCFSVHIPLVLPEKK